MDHDDEPSAYDEAMTIARLNERHLTPPDEAPEFCAGCGNEKPCTTRIRCAWCDETARECTGDCNAGHSAKCDSSRRYVGGVLTRIGCDCIAVWEEHETRWEERREGTDDAREARQ